jgi:predicted glutamine amidotransferase
MCRLFFSFRNKAIRPLLEDFLSQSIHSEKNTPNLKNDRDHLTHPDGFGIAWKNHGEKDWNVYKQPTVFTEDDHLDEVLDTIPNELVIGHIRKKTDGDVSMENTHPFHYNGQIFAQNGKIEDFSKHIPLLHSYISHSLLSEIQGQTDTECLFYMYISCVKYLENRPRYLRKNATRKKNVRITYFTKSQIVKYEKIISGISLKPKTHNYHNHINAFSILTAIFREHDIELVANIIYANSNIVLLTRYIHYDKAKYNEKQIPTSLYWNKCKKHGDNGILITSEPLQKYDSVLFPENTITILDYKKYELVISRTS